ncbi:unnamed protein product [Amoebophrya sp. A120]|nr:unnamed protein product [Amoebophrya sp. A120]|eukprot:GSA120T00011541001.1
MTRSEAFNIDTLVLKFESCADKLEKTGDVDLILFGDGLKEMRKVFDNMGDTFAFAFKDLDDKIETLAIHSGKYPTAGGMLDNEVARGSKPPKDSILDGQGPVSPARAINRSTHVCMFITKILEELEKDKSATMKTACSNAYEPTLCTIHGWFVRNSVRLAFNMLPDRVMFMHNCNMTEQDLAEKGPRFVKASMRLTQHMKSHFDKRSLNWVF